MEEMVVMLTGSLGHQHWWIQRVLGMGVPLDPIFFNSMQFSGKRAKVFEVGTLCMGNSGFGTEQ